MISAAVFTKLSSLSLPFNLQNRDGTYRIYPEYQKLALKKYPALVYETANYEPTNCMDGNDGVPTIDVKVYAIGDTYDDADDLGNAVANAMDAIRGTWGETVIQGCFVDEVSDAQFVDTDLESISFYQKEIVLKVTFES